MKAYIATMHRIDIGLRWASFAGLLLLALLIGLYVNWGAQASDWLADRMMTNAPVATDNEVATTASIPQLSSIEISALGGRGEGIGCSLPELANPAFWGYPPVASNGRKAQAAKAGIQFRQACLKHDYCYRHGAATYQYTQNQCDAFLAEDAIRICRSLYAGDGELKKNLEWCRTRARKVFAGVVLGGAGAFRGRSPPPDFFNVSDPALRDNQFTVSTHFEYDPYPSGTAYYYALRLLDDGCGEDSPMLAAYWGRPGGRHLSYRCVVAKADATRGTVAWTLGKSIGAPNGSESIGISDPFRLPSEFNRVTGAPWLTEPSTDVSARANGLNYWCRQSGGNNPTNGFLATYQARYDPSKSWFRGCVPNPLAPADVNPGTTTLIPVPVGSNLDAQAVYFTEKRLNKSDPPACRLAVMGGNGTISVSLALPVLPDQHTSSLDCYRWKTIPPQFVRISENEMDIMLFRRGNGDGTRFEDTLDVARVQMKRATDGSESLVLTLHPYTSESTIRIALPEEAEPIVALSDGSDSVWLMSVARHDAAAARAWSLRIFGWSVMIAAAVIAIWFSMRAILLQKPQDPQNPPVMPRSLIAFWQAPGTGYATAALLAGLTVFAGTILARDDIVHSHFLGGSMKFTFYATDGTGEEQIIVWHKTNGETAKPSPAHFFQNRVSIVDARTETNAKPSLMMLAPYFNVPDPKSEQVSATLALLRVRRDSGGRWEIEQSSTPVPLLDHPKTGPAKPVLADEMTRLTMLPFASKTGAVHALIVNTARNGQYGFTGDLRAARSDATVMVAR